MTTDNYFFIKRGSRCSVLCLLLLVLAGAAAAQRAHRLDFDGDGRTDTAVVRRVSSGPPDYYMTYQWRIRQSSDGFGRLETWDVAGDVPVPADYDGDLKTDIAVWRPGPVGRFYILQSRDGFTAFDLGANGCEPRVVDDYDRDGKADPAVYCPPVFPTALQGVWTYIGSRWGRRSVVWGEFGDIPVPGDYDGDRAADFVVARVREEPPYDEPHVAFYLNQTLAGVRVYDWGWAGLEYGVWAVPGDYDGDDRTDFALAARVAYADRTFLAVRPSGGGPAFSQNYPGLGDIEKSETGVLVPGDYDFDWRTDHNFVFYSRGDGLTNHFRGVTSSGYRIGYSGKPGTDHFLFDYGDYPLAVGVVRRLHCRALCDTTSPW